MELGRRIPRCSNSPASSSARYLTSPRASIDRNTGAFVPFLWETSPGLPKPYPTPSPASHDFIATPRLPLPPILQSPSSFTRRGQLRSPASFISAPPARGHSLASKVKKMFTRQRSLQSRSFIDAAAVRRAQLESVESCDISTVRKDVVLTIRECTSNSSRLAVGFKEDDLVAESSKSYHGNYGPDCSPRSCQLDGNIFSPAWKPSSFRVVSSFSSASLPRSLYSVSPSSLTSSTCASYGTLSSHEQPSARGASEFAAKMSSQNDSVCSKKSAFHSKSCRNLAENASSALDKSFSRHESVFSEEDFTCHSKVRSSKSGSDALDENVASEVQFPLEFAAASESNRSFTSIELEEFHRHHDFTAGCWDPWKNRKIADSLYAIFSAFDVNQERHSNGGNLKGDKRWHTAKASCLPKMRSTSQRWAVSPFKSVPKAGI